MKAVLRLLMILLLTVDCHQVIAELTNINEVTDLFETRIENKTQYLQELESIKAGGINDIETSAGLNEIHVIEESKSEASRLGSISAIDLQDEGAKVRAGEEYSFYDKGEFEPDLTKPGNKMHKEDVADIVAGTSELFQKLMGKLKELNVDCKTVKGPIQKEPVFVVEVKKEKQENTEYDQLFCEEPRNEYNCTDSLTLSCTKKGIRWNPWKSVTKNFSGVWIRDNHWDWFFSIKFKKKRFGAHLGSNIHIQNQMKQFFAVEHTIPSAQVEILSVSARGHGGGCDIPTLRDKIYMWPLYEVKYRHRSGTEICEQWQETWDERCYLK